MDLLSRKYQQCLKHEEVEKNVEISVYRDISSEQVAQIVPLST